MSNPNLVIAVCPFHLRWDLWDTWMKVVNCPLKVKGTWKPLTTSSSWEASDRWWMFGPAPLPDAWLAWTENLCMDILSIGIFQQRIPGQQIPYKFGLDCFSTTHFNYTSSLSIRHKQLQNSWILLRNRMEAYPPI